MMSLKATGLKELRRDLKRAGPEGGRAIKVANMTAAEKVIDKARGRSMSVNAISGASLAAGYRHIQGGLKAMRSEAKAAIRLAPGLPWAPGYEFGSVGQYRQFPAAGPRYGGYLVYRTIGEMREGRDEIAEAYEELLVRALESVGFPVSRVG